MDWIGGIIGLTSVIGANWLFGQERSKVPATKDAHVRTRLPRDNAHQWADLIEDRLGQLTLRVRVLYVLLGIAIIGLIVASLY